MRRRGGRGGQLGLARGQRRPRRAGRRRRLPSGEVEGGGKSEFPHGKSQVFEGKIQP